MLRASCLSFCSGSSRVTGIRRGEAALGVLMLLLYAHLGSIFLRTPFIGLVHGGGYTEPEIR
jgi:hypothetical protein